jgi:hypothetical protein
LPSNAEPPRSEKRSASKLFDALSTVHSGTQELLIYNAYAEQREREMLIYKAYAAQRGRELLVYEAYAEQRGPGGSFPAAQAYRRGREKGMPAGRPHLKASTAGGGTKNASQYVRAELLRTPASTTGRAKTPSPVAPEHVNTVTAAGAC